MSWEAANLPSASQQDASTGEKRRPQRRQVETVEAALSRLSKAYSSCLECIGAMHRLNNAFEEKKKAGEAVDEKKTIEAIDRLANTARRSFENLILLDPLVTPQIPTIHSVIKDFGNSTEVPGRVSRWKTMVNGPRGAPAEVSSEGHKATIRELAYLSLTNYADLLDMCRISDTKCFQRNMHRILDRGVIRSLSMLQWVSHTFWSEESLQDCCHLALSARCDAADLDASDPILWLKLACSARNLEVLEECIEKNVQRWTMYRRMQRFALERGSVALPQHMPKNRLVQRALRELDEENLPIQYLTTISGPSAPQILKLQLHRYSWAMLGRLLLKAAREGPQFQQLSRLSSTRAPGTPVQLLAAPRIEISIPPILVMPSFVLGLVCSYLQATDVNRMEATCRALSVSILTAQTALSQQQANNVSRGQESASVDKEHTVVADKGVQETGTDSTEPKRSLGSAPLDRQMSAASNTSATSNPSASPQASRVSKRVRSQQIASSKMTERKRNRNSVEFCFCAAVLSCDKSTFKRQRDALDKQMVSTNSHETSKQQDPTEAPSRGQTSTVSEMRLFEAQERTSKASLVHFVKSISTDNSGAHSITLAYLSHVAAHVEDVFPFDPAGGVALTSCLMECFDTLQRSQGFLTRLSHGWYEHSALEDSVHKALERFGLDLLYAEMLFKQCDRQPRQVVGFDDECSVVFQLLSKLNHSSVDISERMKEESSSRDKPLTIRWITLKTRLHWCTAMFYLWLGKTSKSQVESNDYESRGLEGISDAAQSLNSLVGRRLRTPHLVSPGRTEMFWREISVTTLSSLRDEIQAAAVVSKAQQTFQSVTESLAMGHETSSQLNEQARVAFDEILSCLHGRYDFPIDHPDSKHDELIDNFVSIHSDELRNICRQSAVSFDGGDGEVRRFLEAFLPTRMSSQCLRQSDGSLSTITIMLICNCVRGGTPKTIPVLLGRLVTCLCSRLQSMSEIFASGTTGSEHTDGRFNDFSDSDDDSVESMENQNSLANVEENADKFQRHATLLWLFLIRLLDLLKQSDDIGAIYDTEAERALESVWSLLGYQATNSGHNWMKATKDGLVDRRLFVEMCSLVNGLRGRETDLTTGLAGPVQLFVRGCMQSITKVQGVLDKQRIAQSGRSGRAMLQRSCVRLASYLADMMRTLARDLSENLARIENGSMHRSNPIRATSNIGDFVCDGVSTVFLGLCASIMWSWKLVSGDSELVSFERPIARELKLSTIVLMISIVGAASSTRPQKEISSQNTTAETVVDPLSLTELYDSDASANDWNGDSVHDRKRRELLRVIAHAGHCIGLAYGCLDDKEDVDDESKRREVSSITIRIVNRFVDALLIHFGQKEDLQDEALWATEYPYRTSALGDILDSILHSAYRHRYGFLIVPDKTHQFGAEISSSTSAVADMSACAKPESVEEVSQLYRCVRRAYNTGRRAPLKAALELISSSLPHTTESGRSKAIKGFVFDVRPEVLGYACAIDVVLEKSNWGDHFLPMLQLLDENDSTATEERISEVDRVRRGICAELARSPMPTPYAESTSDMRESTIAYEDEISKKFSAILDDICGDNFKSSRAWYRAAQCLLMKSDLIADRIGLSDGFGRQRSNFSPSRTLLHARKTANRLGLDSLAAAHERAQQLGDGSRVPFVGHDLSIYASSLWSSFPTLEDIFRKIGNSGYLSCFEDTGDDHDLPLPVAVWHEIGSMYERGDFVSWQQAWGSIFVEALRRLAVRCCCLALFTLRRRNKLNDDDKILFSELYEMLGVTMYMNVSSMQSYGFPMGTISLLRKRQMASFSRVCFQAAADVVAAPADSEEVEDDDVEREQTWDLLFMIGKCQEKIACTFFEESFAPKATGDTVPMRVYERHMSRALQSFENALEQALAIEKDGGQLVEQAGGSAHGSTEVFYRLHASRLKCLIRAVSCGGDDIQLAEVEALRLTERHWHKEQSGESPAEDHRERIWRVFVDALQAMVQCRQDQHFFHRSVFRHAQALLWAPVICDPVKNWGLGTHGEVPPRMRQMLPDLPVSATFAESAEAVIKTLFDKKRAQLCSVWVTPSTNSSSPFSVVNSTIRKYDSLRGKYISAYVEALGINNKRVELENFLRQLHSSAWDLAGYFRASAAQKGQKPDKPHTADALYLPRRPKSSAMTFLQCAKTDTNRFFAGTILQGLKTTKKSSTTTSIVQNHLKYAYATYLRLNMETADLKRSLAFKHDSLPEVDALIQSFLMIGDRKNLDKDVNDWSGGAAKKSMLLDAALAKCKELFPTLTGSFFTKRTTSSKKQGENKRKAASDSVDTEKKVSCDVAVPEGMKEGDSFLTSVVVGNVTRKVKLTVPGGNPSTLRFTLTVPSMGESEETGGGADSAPASKKSKPSA